MKHLNPPIQLKLSGAHAATALRRGVATVLLEDGHTFIRSGSSVVSRLPALLASAASAGQSLRAGSDGRFTAVDLQVAKATAADSATVTNTASETDFSTTVQLSNRVLVAGRVLRVRLFGHGQYDAVLTSSATIRIYIGSTLVQTFTLTLSSSNVRFHAEALFVIRSSGGGNLSVWPAPVIGQVAGSVLALGSGSVSTVSVPVPVSATTIKASVQWAHADTDNQITLQALIAEVSDDAS